MNPFEVLKALEPEIEVLVAQNQNRRTWVPAELVSPIFETLGERLDYIRELSGRAAQIPPNSRALLALILLTEEGLPYYHHLLASHLGPDKALSRWSRIWTSEEERHGAAIRAYATLTDIFDARALERLLLAYMREGFRPDWKGPYHLLAYTVLQEWATQLFYSAFSKHVAAYDPVLLKILATIRMDEGGHCFFYLGVMRKILQIDPNGGLLALCEAMYHFCMPGEAIAGYDQLDALAARMEIFTTLDYKGIVKKVTERLKIADFSGLSPEGAAAQRGILMCPACLTRKDAREKRKRKPLSIRLPFLYGSPTILV